MGYIIIEESELRQLKREIKELKEQLDKINLEKDDLKYRIKLELEPRLEQEKASYDAYVSYDKAAEGCEAFGLKVEELEDMVRDNPNWFNFENPNGDLIDKVLYLIKQEVKNGTEIYRT